MILNSFVVKISLKEKKSNMDDKVINEMCEKINDALDKICFRDIIKQKLIEEGVDVSILYIDAES